jgi:hypothetical protein
VLSPKRKVKNKQDQAWHSSSLPPPQLYMSLKRQLRSNKLEMLVCPFLQILIFAFVIFPDFSIIDCLKVLQCCLGVCLYIFHIKTSLSSSAFLISVSCLNRMHSAWVLMGTLLRYWKVGKVQRWILEISQQEHYCYYTYHSYFL